MTTPAEPTLRLFVAIELPDDWLRALQAAQDRLKDLLTERGIRRLRWVRPEGIHLTLKFLGGVPETRLGSVRWALEEATRQPFDITLRMGGLGTFVDRRAPRVVWVGVDGFVVDDRTRLYGLAESLETWFAAAGFPRERRFSPHLTLARIPEDFSRDERERVVEASKTISPGDTEPLQVSRISLMRSHLGRAGARYERVEAFGTPGATHE